MAHGGQRAVIGYVLDDSEPGSTVGAVGKWIMMTPVAWLKYIFAAGVTGCQVRGNELVFTVAGVTEPEAGLTVQLPSMPGMVTTSALNSVALPA